MLTAMERALLEEALALPAEHDGQGCPSHRLYASIAALQKAEPDSAVANEMWQVSYDDGRSCPMYSIHFAAKELLKKG
jgi:hypothetical protein